MSNQFNLDKLNNIGSGVDLAEVPQINKKRLLTFLNDFIITTVSFLNNFAQSCESKLHQFDMKMQKLEAELCIIETKLNSIPGLEVNELESAATNTVEVNVVNNIPPPQPPETDNKSNSDAANTVMDSVDETQSLEPTPASQNPELAKYFKLLHLGVPAQAVKLKMQVEGSDPSLLDQ